MSRMAIVMCSNTLEDRGEVLQVGMSLLVAFGMIQGTVCAHGVIHDRETGQVFYLVENIPEHIEPGSRVRVRTPIS